MEAFVPTRLGIRFMISYDTVRILSELVYPYFQGQNLPESEGRFKTLVLVLNGRIRHSLKLSFDVGTLHTAKIFTYILE